MTTLVIAASMCSYNDKETLSTMRFGERAKCIKNKAVANIDRSAKELEILLSQAEVKIKKYEELLEGFDGGEAFNFMKKDLKEKLDKYTQTEKDLSVQAMGVIDETVESPSKTPSKIFLTKELENQVIDKGEVDNPLESDEPLPKVGELDQKYLNKIFDDENSDKKSEELPEVEEEADKE